MRKTFRSVNASFGEHVRLPSTNTKSAQQIFTVCSIHRGTATGAKRETALVRDQQNRAQSPRNVAEITQTTRSGPQHSEGRAEPYRLVDLHRAAQ